MELEDRAPEKSCLAAYLTGRIHLTEFSWPKQLRQAVRDSAHV